MNDQLQAAIKDIEAIKHGLFLLSPDCVRALSTHEADDTIAELREQAERALKALAAVQNN